MEIQARDKRIEEISDTFNLGERGAFYIHVKLAVVVWHKTS